MEALKYESIIKVSGGQHFSLALTASRNQVFAFGRGYSGQLGVDGMETGACIDVPTLVAFPEPFFIADMVAGPTHSMVTSDTHKVYTWGSNTTGNTGHQTEDDEDVCSPSELELLYHLNSDNKIARCRVHGISGGSQHTLMLVKRDPMVNLECCSEGIFGR